MGWLVSGSVWVVYTLPDGGVFGSGMPLRSIAVPNAWAPSVYSRPPARFTLQNAETLWSQAARTSGELNVWPS